MDPELCDVAVESGRLRPTLFSQKVARKGKNSLAASLTLFHFAVRSDDFSSGTGEAVSVFSTVLATIHHCFLSLFVFAPSFEALS